jgi:hypothetical protein
MNEAIRLADKPCQILGIARARPFARLRRRLGVEPPRFRIESRASFIVSVRPPHYIKD